MQNVFQWFLSFTINIKWWLHIALVRDVEKILAQAVCSLLFLLVSRGWCAFLGVFSKNMCLFPPLKNVGNGRKREQEASSVDPNLVSFIRTHSYACACTREHNTRTCIRVHIHVHTCIHICLPSSLSSVLRFYNSSFLVTPVSDNLTQKKPNSYSFDFP